MLRRLSIQLAGELRGHVEMPAQGLECCDTTSLRSERSPGRPLKCLRRGSNAATPSHGSSCDPSWSVEMPAQGLECCDSRRGEVEMPAQGLECCDASRTEAERPLAREVEMPRITVVKLKMPAQGLECCDARRSARQ